MKKKNAAIMVVITLIIMLSLGLTGCKKKNQMESSEQKVVMETDHVETSATTEPQIAVESTALEATESIHENWEVEVLESTPNKITSEVKNQSGVTIKTTMGVEMSDETVPEEQDDAGNAQTQTPHKPAESQPAESQPTEPKSTEPKTIEPETIEPKPTQSAPVGIRVEEPGTDITYADYEAMSEEEQILFYYSFADAEAFNSWYAAAKAAHDTGREEITIGVDGVVNLG